MSSTYSLQQEQESDVYTRECCEVEEAKKQQSASSAVPLPLTTGPAIPGFSPSSYLRAFAILRRRKTLLSVVVKLIQSVEPAA